MNFPNDDLKKHYSPLYTYVSEDNGYTIMVPIKPPNVTSYKVYIRISGKGALHCCTLPSIPDVEMFMEHIAPVILTLNEKPSLGVWSTEWENIWEVRANEKPSLGVWSTERENIWEVRANEAAKKAYEVAHQWSWWQQGLLVSGLTMLPTVLFGIGWLAPIDNCRCY